MRYLSGESLLSRTFFGAREKVSLEKLSIGCQAASFGMNR